MLGPTPSLLREKLGVMRFLLVHVSLQEVECGRLCLGITYPFSVGLSLFSWCVAVTQLVSGFLSERTAPCVNVDLVCPQEELGSGASYFATLDCSSLCLLTLPNFTSFD